jgi:hypothetical protein
VYLYIFEKQTWRKYVLHQMTGSIPWLQSALYFFLNRLVEVVPKYLNSSTLAQEILSSFILWLRPAFWSQDIAMHLVLSAFTSRPIYLLACLLLTTPQYINTITINQKLICAI